MKIRRGHFVNPSGVKKKDRLSIQKHGQGWTCQFFTLKHFQSEMKAFHCKLRTAPTSDDENGNLKFIICIFQN